MLLDALHWNYDIHYMMRLGRELRASCDFFRGILEYMQLLFLSRWLQHRVMADRGTAESRGSSLHSVLHEFQRLEPRQWIYLASPN